MVLQRLSQKVVSCHSFCQGVSRKATAFILVLQNDNCILISAQVSQRLSVKTWFCLLIDQLLGPDQSQSNLAVSMQNVKRWHKVFAAQKATVNLAPTRLRHWGLAALTMRGERQMLVEGDRAETYRTLLKSFLWCSLSAVAAARGTGWRRWHLTLPGATSLHPQRPPAHTILFLLWHLAAYSPMRVNIL